MAGRAPTKRAAGAATKATPAKQPAAETVSIEPTADTETGTEERSTFTLTNTKKSKNFAVYEVADSDLAVLRGALYVPQDTTTVRVLIVRKPTTD